MGNVTEKNVLIFPAPSTFAASYSSAGTCFKPAKNNTMEEPNCQIPNNATVPNACLGLPNQSTGAIPTTAKTYLQFHLF